MLARLSPLRASLSRPLRASVRALSSPPAPVPADAMITSPTDSSLPPSRAIDFRNSFEVVGNDIQNLRCTLQPNQILRTESASMLYMTDGVAMETSTGGGAGEAFKRYLSGSTVMVTDFKFEAQAGTGEVTLGPDFPSKIEFVQLSEYDNEITCAKGSMLCMGVDVELSAAPVKDFKSGFFGGEGFILQKLTTTSPFGGAYITGTGALHRLEVRPGESLRISTGALVAFTSGTLTFSTEMLSGVKNVLFGGEGLFLTKITNESGFSGCVWVQGLESGKFISEIGRRGGFTGGGGGFGMPLVVGGGSGGGGGGGAVGGDNAGVKAGDGTVGAGGSDESPPFSAEAPPSEDTSSFSADPPPDDFSSSDDTWFGGDNKGGGEEDGGIFDGFGDIFSDD